MKGRPLHTNGGMILRSTGRLPRNSRREYRSSVVKKKANIQHRNRVRCRERATGPPRLFQKCQLRSREHILFQFCGAKPSAPCWRCSTPLSLTLPADVEIIDCSRLAHNAHCTTPSHPNCETTNCNAIRARCKSYCLQRYQLASIIWIL